MISRETFNPWLRRPLVLAAFAVVALAALLSGGLVVARAVDGAPAADSTASPSPGSNGDNNVAAGVNTKDGKTVYAIKLKIVQTTSDAVDATNAAVAVNSGCTDCATFAIAFEGVIVVGSPSSFTPTNLALAYNQDCSGCTAFADAYQQVVQTSTRVRVSKQGRKQIAAIRKDLGDLKHSALSLDEIRARVAADEQAFADVLRSDLVPVGHVTDPAPSDAPDVSDNPDAAPTSAQPTAATGTTASPATSPSSSDSGSGSTASPAASDPAPSPSEQPPSPSSSP